MTTPQIDDRVLVTVSAGRPRPVNVFMRVTVVINPTTIDACPRPPDGFGISTPADFTGLSYDEDGGPDTWRWPSEPA